MATLTLTTRPRHRRRDRYSWYRPAEAAWALAMLLAVVLVPIGDLHPAILAVLVAPGGFFAIVRIVAGVADLRASE